MLKFLTRLSIKSVVLGLGLPALGLIAFHGGFLAALIATLVIGGIGTGVTLTFLPAIASEGIVAEMFGAALGGTVGALMAGFVCETVMYGLFIWLGAMLMPGVLGLFGFWATMGAAAILSVVSNVISAVEKS